MTSTRVRTAMATGVAAVIAVAGALAAGAADAPGHKGTTAAASAAARRGQVVSAEHLRTLSAERVTAALKGDEDGTWDTGAVRYGVELYRLVYRTVDPHGRPTTASGLLTLPRGGADRLRTVSFAHGTELYRGDVPSAADDVWLEAPGLTYGSAGFATVSPDYLGLGSGPGPHPWMDVPSETTASLDLLRAARAFVPSTGRRLDREVLATGFSQGAAAALGLGRALQEGGDPWFRIAAVAPVSGAYAMRDAQLPAMTRHEVEPKNATIYAALALVAFDRLHHVYDTPGEVFRAPYAARIERLLDGSHTGQEVVENTPGTMEELLTPRGLALFAHPAGGFAEALRVTDGVCTKWTPKVPVRLYKADADEQAVGANTDACLAAMRGHGVEVSLEDVGTPTYNGSRHLGSQSAATGRIVRWFGGLPRG